MKQNAQKKKNPQELYAAGMHLELMMLKPAAGRGKMPVARTKEGIMCLIKLGSKGYYPYNSTWKCQITDVTDTKIIFSPQMMVKSAEQEETEMQKKLNELRKPKRERVRFSNNYQFCRKGEKQ